MPNVIGAIRDKWLNLGGATSFLGQPLTDELTPPDGVGRFNHFQGGSIYWTPKTGAREVHGAIRDKWEAMGWERSFLGYPLTDELTPPDGVGRFNHFQGGSIYWTSATGAHEVHGAIRDKWEAMGWERSFVGYPISDEENAPSGGRRSRFQHGTITWTKEGGAVVTSAESIHHRADIRTSDWLPAGGWVDLIVNRQGDFTFAGHMHNSGFPNIDYALGAVLMTPSGVGYAFARQHHLDGTVTVFGRNRDDDWTDTGANAQLANNWDQLTRATLKWHMQAADTLSRGVQGMIDDLVKEGALQLGKAGITALIALI